MASSQDRSPLELQLDDSPTGEEEEAAFPDLRKARGDEYDEDKAKVRIDRIARWLAILWTGFLWYIILAQATRGGFVWFLGFMVTAQQPFHLESSEFIAVVTTTTASVFGFLVIVANSLFKRP